MASQYAIDDSRWGEVRVINGYAVFMGYLLMGVRGLGVLILTWAAVVRLGGSASDLGKKDFWCLASITLIQTAGVFEFLLKEKISDMVQSRWGLLAIYDVVEGNTTDFGSKTEVIAYYILVAIQVSVIAIVLCLLGVMYMLGLYISAGVSLWRVIEQSFGNEARDMEPALGVIYRLAVAQGVLLFYKDILALGAKKRLVKLMVSDKLVDEEELVAKYIEETVAGCQKDPSFATGRNFVTYGMDMIIEAKSNKGFIVGIKILGGALKDDRSKSGRKVLAKHLLTRLDMHMIERLLEIVGPRSPYSREVREHAARIVALVARRIRLEQFPGVIECISSVLDPPSSSAEEYKEKRDYHFIELYEEYVKIKNICTVRPHELRDYEGVEVLETYEMDYLVNEIKGPDEAGLMQRLVQFLVGQRRVESYIEMPVLPSTHRHEARHSGFDGLFHETRNIIHQLAVDRDNRRIMSNTVIDKFAMAPLRLHRDNSHDPILEEYWVQWLVAAIKWTSSQGQTLEDAGQPAAAATSGGGEQRSGKEVVVEEGSSSNVGSARGDAIRNIKHTISSIFDCLECGATKKKQAIQILLYLSSDMPFIMDTESRRRRLDWILALIYYFPHGNLEPWWIIGFRNPGAFSTIFSRLAHEKLCGGPGAAETATRHALEDLTDALSSDTEGTLIRTHAAIILQGVCVDYKTEHGEEVKEILLGVIPKVVKEILILCASTGEGRHAHANSEDAALARKISHGGADNERRLLSALVSLCRDGYMKNNSLKPEFEELASDICSQQGKSFEDFKSLLD